MIEGELWSGILAFIIGALFILIVVRIWKPGPPGTEVTGKCRSCDSIVKPEYLKTDNNKYRLVAKLQDAMADQMLQAAQRSEGLGTSAARKQPFQTVREAKDNTRRRPILLGVMFLVLAAVGSIYYTTSLLEAYNRNEEAEKMWELGLAVASGYDPHCIAQKKIMPNFQNGEIVIQYGIYGNPVDNLIFYHGPISFPGFDITEFRTSVESKDGTVRNTMVKRDGYWERASYADILFMQDIIRFRRGAGIMPDINDYKGDSWNYQGKRNAYWDRSLMVPLQFAPGEDQARTDRAFIYGILIILGLAATVIIVYYCFFRYKKKQN